ncbi:MAG TPA: hypothetical protein VH500_25675 [Nitrososphaeraceae archaeon]|jgi:hypothetical protein
MWSKEQEVQAEQKMQTIIGYEINRILNPARFIGLGFSIPSGFSE